MGFKIRIPMIPPDDDRDDKSGVKNRRNYNTYLNEKNVRVQKNTYSVKKKENPYDYCCRIIFFNIIIYCTDLWPCVLRVYHACLKWALVSDFVVGKPTDSYYRRDRRRR